jgi:hypothetical protein
MKISDFRLPKTDNMANSSTKLTINIVNRKIRINWERAAHPNRIEQRIIMEEKKKCFHQDRFGSLLASRQLRRVPPMPLRPS